MRHSDPNLSDLVRDVSEDRRDPRFGPREALRNYAYSADLIGETCGTLSEYLGAVATDERIPDDLRGTAEFWREALHTQLEVFWDDSSSFAWWFEPALAPERGRRARNPRRDPEDVPRENEGSSSPKDAGP